MQGPQFQLTPSQLCSEASAGTGAGFTRVQLPGAKSCILVTPVKDDLDVGMDRGKVTFCGLKKNVAEQRVFTLQDFCLPTPLHPEDWPFSCQKQVLRWTAQGHSIS